MTEPPRKTIAAPAFAQSPPGSGGGGLSVGVFQRYALQSQRSHGIAARSGGTMTNTGSGLSIDWHKALIPLSLITMFILWTQFQAPVWVLALFSLWIPLYYIAYPWYLRRKWTEFDKNFAMKFQQGDYRGLLDYYRAQWFLRKFGPRPEMLSKLALIYSAMEKYRESEQVLERAVELAPGGHRDRLYFNLANVKYELGKYDEAEQMYRALRKGSPYGHSVRTQLALIDLHRGDHPEKAREYLEQERENASGSTRARIDEALNA
jgi:tetratricopeptide (TPR) repeat protein